MRTKVVKIISLLFVVILLVGCATGSGSAVVTGDPKEAIDPTNVKLYVEPPTKYEVIGLVRAKSASGWTDQESMDYAVEELKKQAAKLGANGVLLSSTGVETSTYVGSMYTYGVGNSVYSIPVDYQSVNGLAIYVTGSNR